MDKHINARIAALAEAIERRKMEQEVPVDDLSKSLFAFGQELAGLGEKGKAELLQRINEDGFILDEDAFERFIADYAEV